MTNHSIEPDDSDIAARQIWLGVLARAQTADLLACLLQAPALPEYRWLRNAEVGLLMVQGRIGGSGDAFNLGEMTVVRCSIIDAAERTGHGYAMGRDLIKIALIARLDAVMQDAQLNLLYQCAVVQPLAHIQHTRSADIAGKAAATDVKFFTLNTMR